MSHCMRYLWNYTFHTVENTLNCSREESRQWNSWDLFDGHRHLECLARVRLVILKKSENGISS